jgi:general secretion pathway protein E
LIGRDADRIAQIERVVNLPNGIFLVAGPTASSKTTTLFTALADLDAEALKIVTIEDPIEYSLVGNNQVQVEPQIDMGFPRALRTFMQPAANSWFEPIATNAQHS